MAKPGKTDSLRIKLHQGWNEAPWSTCQRVVESSPITLLSSGYSRNYISQQSLQLNWCHVIEVTFNTSSHGHKLHRVPLSLPFNQINKDIAVASEEA